MFIGKEGLIMGLSKGPKWEEDSHNYINRDVTELELLGPHRDYNNPEVQEALLKNPTILRKEMRRGPLEN